MNEKNKQRLIVFIILFIIIICIITIINIIFIWKNNEEKINKYYSYDYKEKSFNMYKNQLEYLLKKGNTSDIVDKLSEDYLKKIGFTKNEKLKIVKYLIDNGYISNSPSIYDYSYSYNDDTGTCVYKFVYLSDNKDKNVYLMETEPYVYTLSFEEEFSPTPAKEEVLKELNGIKFEINMLESTSRSLKYNVKITNRNNEKIKFDFNNVSSVSMKLKDGNVINLASVIASDEDDYVIYPNSYINQELFFNIALENQGEIKSIVFYNVLKNNKYENYEIEF